MDFTRNSEVPAERFEVSQIAGHGEKDRSERWLRLDASGMEELILQRELNGFSVEAEERGAGFRANLRLIGGSGVEERGHAWMDVSCAVKGGESAGAVDWTKLIERFMAIWPAIGGWQFRELYNAWQWTDIVRVYEYCYGPLPQGARTYIRERLDSIGEDTECIDTSKNPGRLKMLLLSILFVPSAEMWLGPDFWRFAACTKEEALAADFFLKAVETPHWVYLKSWQGPFTRPDGEQGRQQARIWRLLFNEDAEWPPGSGHISDVPMYGPAELMPKEK